MTDRCDFRCRYCMSEKMQFLPRKDLMTLKEIVDLADVFIARGVTRIRLTGGEPLVRRDVVKLIGWLGERLGRGLEELTLTTNGSHLAQYATQIADAGVRRVNVSLDTRDPVKFRHLTRRGELAPVLAGIEAAKRAGLAIKINMVALSGINDDEISDMLRWCDREENDLTLIETMPLGAIDDDRSDHFLPLDEVRRRLVEEFALVPSLARTGGPARYYEAAGLSTRVGFITPLTNNFCDGCNRIRVTATGTVFGCLGHDQSVELRDALRRGGVPEVSALLDRLLAGKPRRHDFRIEHASPAVDRHMSVTGG
ncbi:Cyclic pyranopterin monophosphate synthase [Tsuneonella dongtanensis]|uniref:Cyclic pyranopterin monophosphate synthase n=1 Tax=Tsuneonella dongtanensis TaxID=692370 RepID=A0A1B2A8X6_9SPHN|nr:Cyclic pyranopterin monophosphate synthase [Tsuneonella dongtanensis]